ncbi:MAG: hypothetical protein WD556_06610 [Actinomycetota bacterium]
MDDPFTGIEFISLRVYETFANVDTQAMDRPLRKVVSWGLVVTFAASCGSQIETIIETDCKGRLTTARLAEKSYQRWRIKVRRLNGPEDSSISQTERVRLRRLRSEVAKATSALEACDIAV